MIDAPCVDCQKRHVGCHADCEDYKEWKVEQMSVEEDKRKQRKGNSILNSYTITQKAKFQRKPKKER